MQENLIERFLAATFPFRSLFYLVLPSETRLKSPNQEPPPDYDSVVAFAAALILTEYAYAFLRRKNSHIFNETLLTFLVKMLMMMPGRITGAALSYGGYFWIHENYRIYSIPEDSVLAWIFTMLALDCIFYWYHRAAHEVNILWAFHSLHHSSEKYNLLAGIRNPIQADLLIIPWFYPLALVVPPAMFLSHNKLNVFFQFWIHSSVIVDLGPIEWIMNTPMHHSVHHGRNPYCIDKNYAAVFIIWDRMFGTFEKHRENEAIHYGLIGRHKSFDFLNLYFGYHVHLCKKVSRVVKAESFRGIDKVVNVLKAIFYGPGWSPSKPDLRLGDPRDLPKIDPSSVPYDSPLPLWQQGYCLAHVAIVAVLFFTTEPYYFSYGSHLATLPIALFSTGCSFSFMMDKRHFASHFEIVRCLAFAITVDGVFNPVFFETFFLIRLFYSLSILPWVLGLSYFQVPWFRYNSLHRKHTHLDSV